jgi:hypothetical protein
MGQPTEIAKSLAWQDPSKFKVMVLPTGGDAQGSLNIDPDVLTASVTGIQLAEINTTPVEEWIAEEWRFATGRLEHYQIQLTMKDYENFVLYRMWAEAIQKFSRSYPDDQKFDILVQTATDFSVTSFKPIVTFKDCILITVGGPNLDNSANASIAEFTITAKASYVETY